MYLLKLALRPWRLTPFSQFLSVIAVSVLLVSCAFVLWMERALGPVVSRLQGEQVITVYLNPESVDGVNVDERQLVDSIRLSLGAHAERAEIKVVEPREFLGNVQKRFPELARELEDLGDEMRYVVPKYVSIAGIFPAGTVEPLRKIKGVESVESSSDRYRTIIGAFRAIRWVARILAVGLVFALVSGLLHLARLNAYLHRDTLGFLRLWGASNWQLRVPSVFSGFFVGVIGGGVAAAIFWSCSPVLVGHIQALSPVMKGIALPSLTFSWGLIVTGMLLGTISGLSSGGYSSESGAARS